jgi:hypothetical protein
MKILTVNPHTTTMILTCIALSSSLDAVPGITRPPTALPIRPDVIGLPPTAEFIREKGRFPVSMKSIM